MNKSEKPFKHKLGKVEWTLIIFSLICLVFSFFTPYIFTRSGLTQINFSETGEIGDTIGGIMNPFVALVGVIITFLAFLIQYRANQIQVKNFSKEIKNQNFQFKKSQFETQFYEMLKLHKDNVNAIRIENAKDNIEYTGARAITELYKEFTLIYHLAKDFIKDEDPLKIYAINTSYTIFWNGWVDLLNDEKYKDLIDYLSVVSQKHIKLNFDIKEVLGSSTPLSDKIEFTLYHKLFNGNGFQLAHYYRHLFHTVKHVTKQDEKFISYEEKRNYLRILRAQLTNHEQALLFYNWYSKFGKKWETKENKFFTDYRMIHNLYQNLIVQDINLRNCFPPIEEIRQENKRMNDVLFEFEDH